jgi:hypothetical protein
MIDFVMPPSLKIAEHKRPKRLNLKFIFLTAEYDGNEGGVTTSYMIEPPIFTISVRVPSYKSSYPVYYEGGKSIAENDATWYLSFLFSSLQGGSNNIYFSS